jgi:hypothetical protein
MSKAFSKTNSRAAMVAGWIAASTCLLAGNAVTAVPAFAQDASKETMAVDPAIANEATSRLKLLASIIRNSPQEYARLGYDTSTQQTCAAMTRMYAEKMFAFAKGDPTFSYAIAKSDMADLRNMTYFATCTLPEGLQAKLNVCSTFGMALAGQLTPSFFDPAKMDARPVSVRCPGDVDPIFGVAPK